MSDDDSAVEAPASNMGCVIASLEGLTLSTNDRDLLRHPNLGGIILFARNYADRDQLRRFCEDIRDAAGRSLLIAVDQEGGRVQRFQTDFTKLPPAATFGRLYDDDPEAALAAAREAALTMAFELRESGVDLSFAPVADLDRGCCPAIGNRAFHRQPGAVGELCAAWRAGMADGGMASVAKHFPGHGAVSADSHQEIPVDERPLDVIVAEDLEPFVRLVRDGIEGVMTAHVRYPDADRRVPTFSPFWIGDVLRTKLGFDGVVFSDDLSMEGAREAGPAAARARTALEAGCDVVLTCNDPDAANEVLDAVETPANGHSLGTLLGREPVAAVDALRERVADFAPRLAQIAARYAA